MTYRQGIAVTDTPTVEQQRRDTLDLRTKINALAHNQRPTILPEVHGLEVAKITSTATGDENVRQLLAQFVTFDDTAELRLVATSTDWQRKPRNANALGGFAFATDDLVWQVKNNAGQWLQVMRTQGQIWLGTTTAIVTAGGSGKADIINAAGATINVTCHDFYGEEIGVGVKVVGCYAPDGKNYIIAAACENEPSYEESSGSGTIETEAFILV